MTTWTGYATGFDWYAREAAIPLPKAIEAVRGAVMGGIQQGTIRLSEGLAFTAEETWNKMGRPSYRVAPVLAEALMETRLDVAGAFLRFPHAAFALEMPDDLTLRNSTGGRLLSMLVAAAERIDLLGPNGGAVGVKIEPPTGEGVWNLLVLQRWSNIEEPVNLVLTLGPEDTVEARVAALSVSPSHEADITNLSMIRRFVALALGSAMFAVGANTRFVRPIGQRGAKKRSERKAGNRAPEPRRWSLGADIHLPRGSSPSTSTDTSASSTPEPRALTWGHVRQGHLRMTPCGPQDARRFELRYIAPTIVRPDLPLAPAATRHALDTPPGNPVDAVMP